MENRKQTWCPTLPSQIFEIALWVCTYVCTLNYLVVVFCWSYHVTSHHYEQMFQRWKLSRVVLLMSLGWLLDSERVSHSLSDKATKSFLRGAARNLTAKRRQMPQRSDLGYTSLHFCPSCPTWETKIFVCSHFFGLIIHLRSKDTDASLFLYIWSCVCRHCQTLTERQNYFWAAVVSGLASGLKSNCSHLTLTAMLKKRLLDV